MTGLDKIIEKIASDSDEQCQRLILDADKQAQQILDAAGKEADRQAQLVLDKAQSEKERIIDVAKSGAESITRTRFLQIRNAIINDIISAAYEEIEKMNGKDYFNLLFSLCVKNVETGECVMRLGEKDLKRLPRDFESRINSEVYEKAAVQISKEPCDIKDGFILDYGDFEVNCTLKNVFDEAMDSLKDALSEKLFN